MKTKRIFAVALALSLSLTAFPAASAALTPFRDISDPQLQESVQFLRLMGVTDGVGEGLFNPTGTLSRAEFCAMAVRALDRADEVPAQEGRTIFKDVPSTYWARGYINVASQTTGTGDNAVPGIIRGDATGCFHPDDPITFAEAVTILMRVLGYDDSSVGFGMAWYDGYLATAAAGLTAGLYAEPTGSITRAQAATLFYNLYFTDVKGQKDKSYLVSMGGKEEEGGIILDVDATAADGTTGAVETTKGTYKTDRTFDASLAGTEGKVILDADGKLLAFQVKEGTSSRTVNVISAQATYLTISGGDKLDVEPDTTVYQDNKTTTWRDVYANVRSSTAVTFHYGANGKLSHLYFPSADPDGVTSMVARTAPNGNANPFASMANGGTYTMYKNGVAATGADIRQWDVATWDAGTRVIQVSDLKLTGVYESVSPSPAAPITIKLMGRDFNVLASARNDLASFKPGDKLTLLLTADHQVAGAVSADVVKGEAVGVASVSETTATVKLLQGGLEVTGEVSDSAKDRYNNQLVTVTSGSSGRLSLSLVSGSTARGNLDTAQRKVGDRELAENVVVYDRVEKGAMVEVSYDQLPATVSRSKIAFTATDSTGKINCLVLNDATGDAYQYGYFKYDKAPEEKVPVYQRDDAGNIKEDSDGNPIIDHYETRTNGAPTLCVEQGSDKGEKTTTPAGAFLSSVRNNVPGGVAYTVDGKVAATVYLTAIEKVDRASFDMEEMTVTVAGVSWPVSDKVQCYNKSTKTWFAPGEAGLEAARAYADQLTLYYDRPANEGGKIRMVVIP